MTTASIPASVLFNVVGSVLSAGGNPLSLNGVFLTENTAVPIGAVYSFPNAQNVGAFFGLTSDEYAQALIYFGGYNNATSRPGAMLFAQFNTTNVAAYLRGGSAASLSLSAIQALTGQFTIEIDGRLVTTSAINLAAATSQSSAAALIQAGIQTTGGIFNGEAEQTANGVMTVTSVTSGELHVGDEIVGAGVPAGTTITSFGTGTGGLGTYNVSTTTGFTTTTITVSSQATCSYDAQRQAFVIQAYDTGSASTIGYATDETGSTLATTLGLTQSAGAVLSQGADVAVPATVMSAVTGQTQNWVSFMTVTEQPDATKTAFSAWNNGQNGRYLYLGVDSNVAALNSNATTTFGYQVTQVLEYNGTMPIYDNSGQGLLGAFVAGMIASVDYTQKDGAISYAYKGQTGLQPQITDATQAANLQANGYNFYGVYATAAQQFQFLQPGTVSGPFKWAAAYVDEIWLNNALQVAGLTLMSQLPKAPYNSGFYGQLTLTYDGVAQIAANAGVIETGISLNTSQIADVNAAAGVAIDSTLYQQGYYIQVKDPGAAVRAVAGSPASTFWYTRGGSARTLNLSTTNVQ